MTTDPIIKAALEADLIREFEVDFYLTEPCFRIADLYHFAGILAAPKDARIAPLEAEIAELEAKRTNDRRNSDDITKHLYSLIAELWTAITKMQAQIEIAAAAQYKAIKHKSRGKK